jgi:AraC family transcriptional activator FtrA
VTSHLVALLVHPPLAALEFGYVSEVFGGERPEAAQHWYELTTAAIAPEPVYVASGLAVTAAEGLEAFSRADTIVIPAWRPSDTLAGEIAAALSEAAARGARLVSIGTGAFALAAAGLLDGRRATTHWADAQELACRYPKIQVQADALYVDEGPVVTGAGQTAGLDMLLHLVRRDHGAQVSNALARRLVAPPHRAGDQVQCARRPVPRAKDTRLARVIDHLRTHATQPQRTPDLALMAAMSERSFNRKFRDTVGYSPYDWLLRERVAIARELLEESSLSIDQIGAESGFGSTQSFRNAFKSIVGINPNHYRRSRDLPQRRPIR